MMFPPLFIEIDSITHKLWQKETNTFNNGQVTGTRNNFQVDFLKKIQKMIPIFHQDQSELTLTGSLPKS